MYLGGATSILDADADDAGEEDNGNKTTQEQPGGVAYGRLDMLLGFVLRCRRLGGKVVEVLRNRGQFFKFHCLASPLECSCCSSRQTEVSASWSCFLFPMESSSAHSWKRGDSPETDLSPFNILLGVVLDGVHLYQLDEEGGHVLHLHLPLAHPRLLSPHHHVLDRETGVVGDKYRVVLMEDHIGTLNGACPLTSLLFSDQV